MSPVDFVVLNHLLSYFSKKEQKKQNKSKKKKEKGKKMREKKKKNRRTSDVHYSVVVGERDVIGDIGIDSKRMAKGQMGLRN